MLDEHRTPRRFWAEAVNTACHVSNRILLRAFKKKTCYELLHGRAPKVSHFRVFGCKCFILKKGKLDKFEARSSDSIFFGYANHSRAYRVLNIETNKIMETCEITLDETMPCTSLGFECAGDEEKAEDLFEEEKDEAGDDDVENHAPEAECIPTTSPTTTTERGPSTSCTTTVQQEDQAREAEVEWEVVSRHEAPRRIQEVHPLSKIIGNRDERTTRSRSRNSLILLMLLLLPPLSPRTLDMLI
jgi:hypothetical protein